MKKLSIESGSSLNLLNQKKEEFRKEHSDVLSILKRVILLVFVIFAFNTTTFAQSSSSNDNEVGYIFKKDKASMKKAREKLMAVREEKRQLKELNDIPQATMTKFNNEFPKAQNVSWEVPGDFIEADFTFKNKSKVAFYDWNNHLMGHGTYINYSELPAKARAEIAKKYAGYTAYKTMWYDDNEDNDNDIALWGITLPKDSYITAMQKGNKQIALQIDRDGEVTFFSEIPNN